MDITTILYEAQAWAQRCFHDMIETGTYGDPSAFETQRYVAAERHLDDLLVAAQWERAKARLDLALGDHFAGMPS